MRPGPGMHPGGPQGSGLWAGGPKIKDKRQFKEVASPAAIFLLLQNDKKRPTLACLVPNFSELFRGLVPDVKFSEKSEPFRKYTPNYFGLNSGNIFGH